MEKIFVNEYIDTQNVYIEKCREILKEKFKGLQPLFYQHSYGCQGNVSEGEKIEGILNDIGYKKTNDLNNANIIILNTCAIREKAQDKVFSNLGNILNLKINDKEKIIGICGCMVQQEHVKKRIEENFKTVNLIFGPHVIDKLPQMLYRVLSKEKKRYVNIDQEETIKEGIPVLRNDKIKALVPISYGCNNFCSYCIVPYVKGRERSRNFNVILDEVKKLVECGYKEIMLLGQNVNSYGLDLNLKDGFSNLLYEINKIKGNFWVRFMTSHPKDFTKKLVDVISICDKVCKHFHLPIQSGCDRILLAMNRKYDRKKYLEIIDYVKKTIKNATFTTDIIVGFPGEIYEEFKETLKVVEKVKYISIFNFIFSKRVGTKAEKMPDLISKKEKTKWLEELIERQNEISLKLNESYVGKEEKVLFEGVKKAEDDVMIGRTAGNILVCCKKDEKLIGNFGNVRITKAHRTMLEGSLIF